MTEKAHTTSRMYKFSLQAELKYASVNFEYLQGFCFLT
jgi:hypothetical protein